MRVLMAALAAASLGISYGEGLPSSYADTRPEQSRADREEKWRQETCRFQSLQRPIWTQREENLTAACVVRHWPIEGGLPKLVAVGACESGWYRLASNGGRYLGLFQHAAAYWSARTALVPETWRTGNWSSVWNSRAQIVVTVQMVRSGGWGPWGCA